MAPDRRVLRALALVWIVGTYWTLEVFYAWFKAWGDPHFDQWFTVIAYSGIGAALLLFLLRPESAARGPAPP